MSASTKVKCRENGCETRPCYNYPNEKGLRYCNAHKLEGMVYKPKLYKKTCEYAECDKAPSYNFPQSVGCRFCSTHKLPGMVSCKGRCSHPGCDLQPNFNYPGQRKRLFCSIHKKDGMVRTSVHRKCEAEGCEDSTCVCDLDDINSAYQQDLDLDGVQDDNTEEAE